MKLPNELYVNLEGEGQDEFLNAQCDPKVFAIAGETETVTLYRKVGIVRITAAIEITMPKRA